MAYTPTEWATGDVITAQKLNKMEQGIAGAGAGMRLYGPYYASASNPSAIPAGESKIVSCRTLEDINGITVTYPATDAALLLTFLNTGIGDLAKGQFISVKLPTYDESWVAANVQILNTEAESKTYEPRIGFYSSVEFPQES